MDFWQYMDVLPQDFDGNRKMGIFDSASQLRAVVVGCADDELVQFATSVLNDYEIGFDLCEDVYCAVVCLTKQAGLNLLVVGRLELLSKSQGRFFQKINEKNVACCCFGQTDSVGAAKRIQAAKQAGAYVITETAEFEMVLSKLLTDEQVNQPVKEQVSLASAFNKDEFVLTKAERDALLNT